MFNFEILPQPDDQTCGATCLHSIYTYYNDDLGLSDIINEIPTLATGGTLAVTLGTHALIKGYKATIYTYNLHVFDPTWFMDEIDLVAKLRMQMAVKDNPKLHWATENYINFLRDGGQIKFQELDDHLLRTFFDRKVPILTGLNATYLYRTPREYKDEFDDVRGTSMGHFVILYGFDTENKKVLIADPLRTNPISNTNLYSVSIDTLINSIMLGIVTYDANFLVIEKKDQ